MCRREREVHVVIAEQSDAELLQIVLAPNPPRRGPRLLYGGQQQRDQDPNDGDHDEQFDQRESTARSHETLLPLE